jgi:hypothetical protein
VYDWCKHYRQTTRFNYNAVHPDCPFTTYDYQQCWAKALGENCKGCPQDTVQSESGTVDPEVSSADENQEARKDVMHASISTATRPALTRGRIVWSFPEFRPEDTLDMARSLASNWNVLLARRGGHLA